MVALAKPLFRIAFLAPRFPAVAPSAANGSLFSRMIRAIAEANRRKAEREIAAYLHRRVDKTRIKSMR